MRLMIDDRYKSNYVTMTFKDKLKCRHAEQLLFWCPCSKVSICDYVTCHMSHVACHMSHVKCLSWSLGHAEQFLFSCLCSNIAVYGCKRQWVFFDNSTLTCESTNHRAGSQLKICTSTTWDPKPMASGYRGDPLWVLWGGWTELLYCQSIVWWGFSYCLEETNFGNACLRKMVQLL